jgi:ribosomal-protein-alanine N-acetyltransferase
VLYRPYTPQDFDVLYALEEVCFEPPFRFDRRTMRLLVQRKHAATWIAEDNAHMAGFAIVEWTGRKRVLPGDRSLSQGCKSGITAYIQTIEVAPEARRRGVGGELLGRIEGSACAAGASLIWLHVEASNARAIRLYEERGYLCEGRQENYYPRDRAALIYLKRLDSGLDGDKKPQASALLP